jgi:YD repeat-containing protein
MVRRAIVYAIVFVVIGWPRVGAAQTTQTYHLHKEVSSTNSTWDQLKPIGPDGTSIAIASADLKNTTATEAVIKRFDTQAGAPGQGGVIPANSSLSFTVFMSRTGTTGTFFPRFKVFVNSESGTPLCTATGTSALTTSTVQVNINCQTGSSPIVMTSTDRFMLWTGVSITAGPGNRSATASVSVEGTLNGNFDSRTVLPLPQPPSIASLTPARGPKNTIVHVAGSNFASPQGTSTIAFNGVSATASSWSNLNIDTTVPAAATTGNVVVTVGGRSSTGMNFTVTPAPNITSINPTTAGIGQNITINGTNFLAQQADGNSTVTFFNGVVASVVSWGDTAITATVPAGAQTGPVGVTVSGNPNTGGATFTLPTTGTIAGAITRTTGGSAISGATIQAVLTGVVKGSATSAANGSYTIANLDPGTYDVRVSATGFSPEVRSAAIAAGGTATVNVGMQQPGSVSGTVTQTVGGAAISGAAVALYLNGVQKATTSTNGSGVYSVANLHPGAYTVRATNAGNRTKEQGVTIPEAANATANLTLDPAGTAPIQYVYDELNRLVSVIDGSGDAAHYTYDKVGNITSIVRAGSTSVSISEFTPNGGPIGSTVTIYGTGFSTTSPNTVTFGGGSVQQTASSPNQITVTVPTGATSAPIGLSNASGSATSSGTFTVGAAALGAPTVSGFTPGVAAPGATLTINGTNFETTASNDRLTLNATFAAVSTATATSLTAVIPTTTTSGPVTVATPAGTATSATDLYVPPAPHVPGDVDVAQRIAIGDTRTVTINTAGHIALYTVPGVQGHRVSLNGVNGITGFVLGCDANASILLPSGGSLGVSPQTCVEQNGFIDASVLPATGIYTVYIEPVTPAVGNIVTFTLYDVTNDVTGTIMPGGAAVTVTTTKPGENARLTFTGTAGHRVSALGTNGLSGQILGCDVNVSVLSTTGQDLAFPVCMEQSGFLDTVTLPANGTYTFFIDPQIAATGSLTLTAYDVPADVTGTIAVDGSPVTVTMTTPGQNALLTFSGTAGQRISLGGTNGMSGQIGLACDVNATILNPNGTVLSGPACMEQTGFIEPLSLPTSGTYSIVVDPVQYAVGSLTLALYTVSDQSGTIVIGGPPQTIAISVPGQNAALTFSGTAGQRISLLGSNVNGFNTSFSCDLTVTILKPDTTTLASACMDTGGFIDAMNLPTTGTYTILVDPLSGNTGSITLTLYGVSNTSSTTTIGGTAQTVTIGTPGQNHTISFSGTSGQRVSLTGTNASGFNTSFGCDLNVSILKPDTSVLTGPVCMDAGGFIDATALTATGTYTIVVDPIGANTGSVTLQLYAVSDTSGTIAIGGVAQTVTIGTPGQNGTLTFSGTSGQRISLLGTNASGFNVNFGCDLNVSVLKPDTTVLTGPACMDAGGFIDATNLPATGTYTISIDPVGSVTGSLTLQLYSVTDFSSAVTVNGAGVNVSLGTPGQNGTLTFTGTASQVVSLHFTNATGFNVNFGCDLNVTLKKPDGSTLSGPTCMDAGGNMNSITLPTAGTYTIFIDPLGSVTGSMTVSVSSP